MILQIAVLDLQIHAERTIIDSASQRPKVTRPLLISQLNFCRT